MIRFSDLLQQSRAALTQHKLRTVLTIVGLMLGVATLIGVMTLVQGANYYVETKIANLGTNVFQVARTPFAATDLDVVLKALKYKKITMPDVDALRDFCTTCREVGASGATTARVRYQDRELTDVTLLGHSANMAEIDTRALVDGRYFSESEALRSAPVCMIGQGLVDQLFRGEDALNRTVRVGQEEFTVIGVFEKLGSVLGQDQDNFLVIPLNAYLKTRAPRTSLTINILASPGDASFQAAMDQTRLYLRARRHVPPNGEEDFFIGTKDSYIALWNSISGAFSTVFIMVSSISALVGGIVIMNVMLVSVTERTKEIGIRRAVGATQDDIRQQFLSESVIQCLIGGAFGILGGFLGALAIRTFTEFPADVQTWVAVLGLFLSSAIGLFFGIYPASRAAALDPVAALRADK